MDDRSLVFGHLFFLGIEKAIVIMAQTKLVAVTMTRYCLVKRVLRKIRTLY